MTQYTVFCQDASGTGTIWIDTIDGPAEPLNEVNLEALRQRAASACAEAWGYESACDIHCLGIALGDVKIVNWVDIED